MNWRAGSCPAVTDRRQIAISRAIGGIVRAHLYGNDVSGCVPNGDEKSGRSSNRQIPVFLVPVLEEEARHLEDGVAKLFVKLPGDLSPALHRQCAVAIADDYVVRKSALAKGGMVHFR
jgi:hypothetical protein